MLKKLLKYDTLNMIKNMMVFYILFIVFSTIYRVVGYFETTSIINIIKQVVFGCMVAMGVSIIANTVIRSFVRFKDSLYGDEAYLTHTLPVSKTQIYESKFIQTIIFVLASILFAAIGLFIAYYSKENWNHIIELVTNISVGYQVKKIPFILSLILIIVLEIVNAIQAGYLGIIIGNMYNSNRLLFSIIYGFITYIASQSITLLLTFIIAIFDPSIMKLFISNVTMSGSILIKFIIISICTYSIAIAVVNIVALKLFNKGVNVE